jgi:peptidoglycan/LPS O-acetylase OafA/YrhL
MSRRGKKAARASAAGRRTAAPPRSAAAVTAVAPVAAAGTAARFAGLDTLRGFAVLRIVVYHFTTRYHQIYGHHGDSYDMTRTDFSVPMFFVISGFVIPLTLSRCRSAGEFAFLRVTRLYPTYWVCVLITFAIVAIVGLPGREVPAWDAVVNLTMVPEALGAQLVDGAYWTLQVELVFYALMAVIWALGQVDKAALVFLGLALLRGLSHRFHPVAALAQSQVLAYAHLFAIGILLHEMRYARRRWHYAAFCVVWVTAFLDRGPEYLVWIAVFFALTALSVFVDAKIFRIRPLVWFGALSYPLYLLHQNVGYVVLRAADRADLHPYVGVGLAFATVLALAYVVHRFVEQPTIDWARELRKRYKARSVAAASVAAP